MILTLNNLTISKDACNDDIMNTIDHLKLSEYSVIVLENIKTKDYIQSICHRFKGIVEMRINNDFNFKHYRALIPNYKLNNTTYITTNFFNMEIETANLLNTITIKKILIDFLNQNDVFSSCQWYDMTNDLKY